MNIILYFSLIWCTEKTWYITSPFTSGFYMTWSITNLIIMALSCWTDVGITTKFYRTYCNDVTIFLFFSSDIHAIVEEVASLNEIDLQQTMSTLIQKWLPSASSKQQDADAVCINNNFLWKAKTSTCRQLNFVVLVVYCDIPVILFLIIKDLWLQAKGSYFFLCTNN